MVDLFTNSLNLIYIALVLLAIYGAFKGNFGLILFSYLVVSFKTNLLTKAGVADTYFEPQYIIALVWLFSLFIHYKGIKSRKILKSDKSVLILVITLFMMSLLETIKANNYFHIESSFTLKSFIKELLEVLVIWTFILNIRRIKNIDKHLRNGILFGVTIIAFQSFFSGAKESISYSADIIGEGERVGGFMKSDLNELTSLMTIPAYFILILVSSNKINRFIGIPILAAIFISVLLTGSRTGLFAAMLSPFFLLFSPDERNRISFNSKRSKYILFSIIFVALGYYLLQNFGGTTLSRLNSEKINENVRVQRYPEYYTFFTDNPDYLITGALKEITSPISYRRAAHNFYIQRIYSFGILYLILILMIIWRVTKYSNKFVVFPVIIFLFYGMALSNPPLGYLPFIIIYFNHCAILEKNKVGPAFIT